jgi:hypothetical protein
MARPNSRSFSSLPSWNSFNTKFTLRVIILEDNTPLSIYLPKGFKLTKKVYDSILGFSRKSDDP